ncbi:MAG: excinuclease ABC subunit UvrC [Myxococcales bacterium]|nr:excinuclease ABC subunit UvrC [Myxococcales bacterium]
MAFDPATDIERIPPEPGVYLMHDGAGEVIYVGKAANLKARVRQYFGATSDSRAFVRLLDRVLDRIDVIITSNEKEALILENELIKRHQPRFNVELKDDKNFLHLRIDDRVDWPRIDVVRRPRRDGAKYFGPYHSASQIRATLKLVERHFRLRNCDDLTFRNRARPCLQYQIKRCPGPCVLPVDREDYQQQVREVVLFLQGRHDELARQLETRMRAAAAEMAYERAARLRDQLHAVRGSLEDQQMVDLREIDRDVLGLYREGGLLQVVVLLVRRGRMVGSRAFTFDRQGAPDADVLSTFCNLFYNAGNPVPDEVLVPIEPDAADALRERLGELRGRRVTLKVPRRGAAAKLLEMAARNAEHAFFQARREEAVRDGGLVRLKKLLGLANLPYLIECFDISIFQGASPVASKVVFEGGVPKRAAYRTYKIREVEGTDDFAMMREVLMRRLRRGLAEGDLPNLLVVDGGKGQLNVARAVFADLGIEGVDLVGLAKSRVLDDPSPDGELMRSPERVFLPGVKDPIVLRAHTDELFLMTHLRDEAHRFAITFHRKQRTGSNFKHALDEVPGLGPKRRKALVVAFGNLGGTAKASVAELAAVEGIGQRLAEAIHAALHGAAR